MGPLFLTEDEALRVHADQVARYGGSAGVRDEGMLLSALAMPQSGFGDTYFHLDVFEMSAAYLYHTVQNHPFVDGNKRTGAVCARLFLELNGVHVTMSSVDAYDLVIGVAEGRVGKPEIADAFRANSESAP